MKFASRICILFLSVLMSVQISAQDISEIISLQEIDTILYSGPKDNRINWAIQNRSVDNPNNDFANREEFVQLFEEDLFQAFTLGGPNEQIPYAQYRNFFNLYAFWWPDALSDSEGWNFNIIKGIRDSLFLPWANDETGWATLFSSTKFGGGGGAGLNREARVGDGKMYGMGWETFLHEFGHTMPGLLDEYSASGEWSGGQCWETPNTTGKLTWDDIPWRLWVDPETPLPTPYTAEYLDSYGAFEGAMTNYFGCHRPTARGCYMGAGGFGEDYGLELCGPCRQRVICFLYRYVNVIENFSPSSNNLEVNGAESILFQADVLAPNPNTQKYEWILNGKIIAEGVTELELSFEHCDSYELIFAVTDTNTLVKYDPKFEEPYPKPYREVVWQINQTAVNNYDLALELETQNANCTGENNGWIQPLGAGGTPPYEAYYQNEGINEIVEDLAPGEYEITLIDYNGCGQTETAIIEADALLDAQICSEFENGNWTLSLASENYDIDNLEINWSMGDQTPTVENLPNGDYQVSITTPSGCSITESIALVSFEEALAIDSKVIASDLGESNGKIFLDISGGVPPYTIEWADKINKDVTDTNNANINASGTTWGHLPEYAFDNSLSTKWLHFVSSDAWISYQIPGGAVINSYSITSADDVPARDPKNWRLEGSQNGTNWTTLHTQTGHQFNQRFEKRAFLFQNETSYNYYRFYVEENHGDGSIQLQQLEFIGNKTGDEFEKNEEARNQANRQNLASGLYAYSIKDQNGLSLNGEIQVGNAVAFIDDLVVVADGTCGVKIEHPNSNFDYYWLPDAEASSILHIGDRFQPTESTNYYVAAVQPNDLSMSENRKGFAVTLAEIPAIEVTEDSLIKVIDPNPDMLYSWYVDPACSTPIATGDTFDPQNYEGFYYATAIPNIERPEPINPNDLSGIVIRMDASDLNGDGTLDSPAPATSSILDWQFENGNYWADGNWFAFRSNYQNGLGVSDFATIWLQRLQNPEAGYRTIIMAYEENPISFPNTAPFEGLSQHIPRHNDASQLFANSTPSSTINGATLLNGEIVDPLNTPNPLEFCILGVRLTQVSNAAVYYTDVKWEGKIGEILLWEQGLTNEEIAGVSEYLRKKWISTADLESPKAGVFFDGELVNTEEVPSQRNTLILFPNPSSDIITIQGLENTDQVSLISLAGKILQEFKVNTPQISIQIGNLPEGIYLVQAVNTETGRLMSTKFVTR